jgi:predicted N-acetyltransferase YhbS
LSGSTDDERTPAPEGADWRTLPLAATFSPNRNAKMSLADVVYLPETPAHAAEIDAINEEAFGPGRFARAAYKIREGGPHERVLSFVAVDGETVVASVRMTRIAAGQGLALMLGPLAVRPAYKNLGIGRRLVAIALEEAAKAAHPAVILVGDEPYYGPLGFKKMPRGQIAMPRPVDLDRLLSHEIVPGAVSKLTGMVHHADAKETVPA